jgi:hypothetical protein
MNKYQNVCLALLLASFSSAHAQTLSDYFNFTQDGTVASGGTVSAQYGPMTGTVQSTDTSITSSGLTVTGGTGGATGLALTSGSLAPFTSDFSLQMYYTNSANVLNGGIFGGVSGGAASGNISGDNVLFTSYNNGDAIRPVTSNGGQYGATNATPPDGTGSGTGSLLDVVLTYTASSQTLSEYVNGVSVASGNASGFNGLAAVTNFAIGGVTNNPFGDPADQETATSFLFYTGALSSTEVAALDADGATPTLDQISTAGITVESVPEPSTYALLLGGMGLLVLLRKRQSLQS